jgi:hypothetical protein
MRSANTISPENLKQVDLVTEGRITPQWILEKTRVRTEQDSTGSVAGFCEHGSIKVDNFLAS